MEIHPPTPRYTIYCTSSELSDAERRLGIALANVRAMQQIAEPLDKRYVELLTSAQD